MSCKEGTCFWRKGEHGCDARGELVLVQGGNMVQVQGGNMVQVQGGNMVQVQGGTSQ